MDTRLRPLKSPKINEALESALAAIDKESSHQTIEEYFPQPPTVPSSNNIIISASTTSTSHTSMMVQQTEITLINKTDEEKCEKLQNEQQQQRPTEEEVEEENVAAPPGLLALQEKSEEEISKEPIYENVIAATSVIEIDVGHSAAAPATKAGLSKQQQQRRYQQQQHEEQQQATTIPSMISNQKPQQLQSDQLKLNQNDDVSNQNLSNQLKISQINSVNSCPTTINHNNISNNNSNNNSSNNNVVELTNAFANTTIITTTTTTKTTTNKKTAAAATVAVDNDKLLTTTATSAAITTNNNNHNNNNNNNKNNLSRDLSNHLKPNPTIFSETITIEQKNPLKNTTTSSSSSSSNTIISSNNNNNIIIIGSGSQNSPLEDIEPTTALTVEPIEPYYQVPKSSEPYYDAPKHLKPVPVYENIEIFFNGSLNGELSSEPSHHHMQPPKEKPPPPPIESPPLFDDVDSSHTTDTYSSSDNTYETLSRHQLNRHQMQQHQHHMGQDHHSPPMKRMNSTKRIKKEIRNKRSSFLGIEGSSMDDDDSYLELTVAPPPDMAQLLQEERRLEKQLYLKAALCDSSDTGESRDSGVSENHSRQSSEHYTNSSEENEPHDDTTSPLTLQTHTTLDATPNDMIYQNDGLLVVAPTPLLQTVKGNSAESWTESATVAAAATQSLTEATATANAKMMSIEEKIREQEEVLRVERELLQLEQEELKRQRENLMLRENMARRELQHGAKMLMSANRRSLQDLNGLGAMTVPTGGGNVNIEGTMMQSNNGDMYHVNHMNGYVAGQPHYQPQAQPHQQQHQQQQHQQIYANIPNLQQQYYQMDTDYRKSMSDINEFSKRMMQPPVPPSKPMRAMHVNTTTTANGLIHNGGGGVGGVGVLEQADFSSRQRHSLNTQQFGGSLVKIATGPTAAPRGGAPHIYSNYHHQSEQNLNTSTGNLNNSNTNNINNQQTLNQSLYPGNMSRNTLHALSATPKPKYTDGWVQVQQRKNYDSNLANDPAWVSAYQQKRKSMPDSYHSHNTNNNSNNSSSSNHWLVQEAEQRRLVEQQQRRVQSSSNTPVHQVNKLTNGGGGVSAMNPAPSNGKPLPDSIIQTLTERVQSKGIGDRKRNNMDKSPLHAASQYHQYNKTTQITQQSQIPQQQQQQQQSSASSNLVTTHRHTTMTSSSSNGQLNNTSNTTSQDKVLSVSGKKKCSHCGDELGRGAAMIIESLLLFYHINCFKCCVCHVQLGDGLNGTDVRVRNHKLHCQNCYSSDDGIKFSCV